MLLKSINQSLQVNPNRLLNYKYRYVFTKPLDGWWMRHKVNFSAE